MIANEGRINIPTITTGALLVASGFVINYLLERHNTFKMLENSAYPISWADLFYPPFCVLLCLAGMVFIVGSALRHANARALLRYTAAIAIPLTVLYTFLAFAMQFIQTGADRLGECSGLDEAAGSSSVIPESKWRPGYPAVGCAVERRGIFLAYYNDITVYGVTDPVPQALVLSKLREHYRQLHHASCAGQVFPTGELVSSKREERNHIRIPRSRASDSGRKYRIGIDRRWQLRGLSLDLPWFRLIVCNFGM